MFVVRPVNPESFCNKRVGAILQLQPPKTKHQLQHFLGMINYYRDMWRRRSHLLVSLTKLVGSQAKYIVWGDVYTDASNYQLGAVIMQENKPLAFLQEKNELRANW